MTGSKVGVLATAAFTCLCLLLAACDSPPGEEAMSATVAATKTEVATDPTIMETATVAVAEAVATVVELPTAVPDQAAEETAVPATAAPQPVEVAAFTPAQQEGPYYPLTKPADRDNDLVALQGATGPPVGQVLEFGGTIYDARGLPVEGALVEIWQTDASGVYDHPGDPGTERRDRNFQFYGEAVTGGDGRYQFRTLLPGLYEPRPRHIHVKVRLDGEELLTTQFYFAGEIGLQGADALMLIDARPESDGAGNAILRGERDIFLDIHR